MFTNISETAGSEVNGSSRQGQVTVTYNELVEIFGQPGEGDGYKVQKEWVIRFDEDTQGEGETIATIYDWKWGDEYNGDGNGTHYTNVPEWNIGGFDIGAVHRVLRAIKAYGSIEGQVVQKLLN